MGPLIQYQHKQFAVSEIYKVIGKAGNTLDFIPGMEKITQYLQVFVRIALGSIDECCLGYTFIHPLFLISPLPIPFSHISPANP